MSDWANALLSGIGAAANTGAGIIGDQMKQDAAALAEQRAADVKLDTAQRLMAMEEAMKTRAAERFSGTVKAKMGEQLPVDAQTVQQTGITSDSAKVLGKFDFGNGPEDATGITGGADKIKTMLKSAIAASNNPDLTDAQRSDARGLADQLGAQVIEQDRLNKEAVDGKTRTRTIGEARQAALDDTLQNDPGAFIAGTGMLGSIMKDEATQRAADLKERLATSEADRKERQANADRDSREAIAADRDAQREKAADQRYEAMMARIEAGFSGGKGNKSALIQNMEWLRDNLKWTPDQLADYVTEKKHLAPEDIAAKLLSADKFGELTPETAMQRATQLVKARDAMGSGGQAGSSSGKVLNYDPKTGKFN